MPMNHPELADLLRHAQTQDEQLLTQSDHPPLPAVFQALQLAKASGVGRKERPEAANRQQLSQGR